jgi:V8-like Glu-specific endopeptidase
MHHTFDSLHSASEIDAYWTPERMAAALPEPLLFTPPTAPPAPPALAQAVADPTVVPYRRVGKLFYSNNGSDYAATACVVARSGIFTAAHCIWDIATQQASSKYKFVPAYTSRTEPFGHWLGSSAKIDHNWKTPTPNYAYDVGFITLMAGGSGDQPQFVGDAVGVLAISINQNPKGASWNDIGYPINYDAGAKMYEEIGAYVESPFPDTIGKAGTFYQGASGGPWLDANQKVNGIQSFVLNNPPTAVYSARFADWVAALIA